MKRSLGALGLFLSGALASGCPMYSDNVAPRECFYATDCPLGFRCSSWGECVQAPPHGGPSDGGGTSDAASDGDGRDAADAASPDAPLTDASVGDAPAVDASSATYCGNPSDCAANETCSSDGTCRVGACSMIACVNQFQCATTSSGAACVRGNPKGCGADRHCGSSDRCVDGVCTPMTDLCTDRSQCGADKVCADGRCITACSSDAQCPAGFLCRTALGYCGAKAKSCVRTSECGNANEVCVDGACVPRCSVSGACGDGGSGVCVDNGCVPRAGLAPSECSRNGSSCGIPNWSCVRGFCYLGCQQDAGGCDPQSGTPVCHFTSAGGFPFAVCGAADRFGNECDPTTARACIGGRTCIDGYCR